MNNQARYTRLSGLEPLVITPELLFVNVGERTNVTGSAQFKKLIKEDRFEEAVEVARQQVARVAGDHADQIGVTEIPVEVVRHEPRNLHLAESRQARAADAASPGTPSSSTEAM